MTTRATVGGMAVRVGDVRSWATMGAALIAAALVATAGASAEERPDYRPFSGSVHLRYLNADGHEITAVPRIGLSFGGKSIRAELDSGSTGVVVAAASIPGFDQLPAIGAGRLTYTSSGRVMIGSWVTTPVTLTGADGASVTTEPMPVLAVTKVECLEQARNCTANDDPRGIAMVGVGFAREGDRQAQSTPEKNPLLRVAGEGHWRRGYVLTADGVDVGLTAETTRGDIRFIKLERQADLPDWAGIPACITIAGKTPPACGTMLVDTGVADMFLTVPARQAAVAPLPEGTEVAIAIGKAADAVPLYSFKVGNPSDALAPGNIHLRVADRPPFVNTSFHLLNGFDLLYDADGGYAGFRQR